MSHDPDLQAYSDEQLAAAAKAGDEAAAHELFDRHREEFRGRVRARLPALMRRKVAESDVIQEAYLAAFASLANFEEQGDGSFRRWLATILDRRIKSELRRYTVTAKRALKREISVAGSGTARAPLAADPTPSGHAVARESQALLREAVRELPEDYRTVLRLVHDEHRSLVESAEIMGRSGEAVRKLYGRAVARLADRLKEEDLA
jgi:RNA polymerase sigma-70 factor (ECF subfamily)